MIQSICGVDCSQCEYRNSCIRCIKRAATDAMDWQPMNITFWYANTEKTVQIPKS